MDEKENTQVYKIKGKKGKKTKKRGKFRRIGKIILRVFLVLFILGLIAAGIFTAMLYTMFQKAKLNTSDIAIKYENSVVKDINGEVIAVLSGDENRESISISEMPTYLPEAFIAIEDERFKTHNGVDLKRTIAATGKFILSKIGIGHSNYGGSTITQQLVKNLTDEKDRSWERKAKEMARAYYIEQEFSKEQILELYLNLIFLGGRTNGVEVASNYYFSKSAKDLSLAESAFLAGINNAPNSYNPFEEDDDDNEKMMLISKRTKVVLAKMLELGKIKQEEYNTAVNEVNEGLKFTEGKIAQNNYSYHTDAAVLQVIAELQEKNDWTYDYAKLYVMSGGLTIYSTQNTNIQNIMQEEFSKDKYNKTATKDGVTYNSQAAMAVIDYKTGFVLGVAGGLGGKNDAFGLNRATQSRRQTGSSMKPLAVLVPGIDTGAITAATGFDDVPKKVGTYKVKNSTGYRGLTTTRYAIETSQNIPMVEGLQKTGIDTSIEYLKNMGISSLVDNDKYLGLALGGLTNGISPLEMSAAYGTIANDGVYIEPTFYTKVVDKDENVILETEQETRTVMSKAAAYVVKEILTQPAKSGTATFCSISGMSVAAKTGTTDDNYDRWLCGFTPYYAAATWFGYDANVEVKWSGRNPAGMLWDEVMTPIHSGLASAYFSNTRPGGVTSATVCKCSGLLATDFCKQDPRGSQAYTEYFVQGTVPKEYCTCHVSVDICKDTELLANEHCPNKETKIFITRPNSETDTSWQKAKDAEYMLTIKDTCKVHKAVVVVEPEKPAEGGNTTGGNTTGGNTTGGNTIGGNETGGNTTGGNETRENTTSGNETGGNTTGNTTTNTSENTGT